MTPDRDGELCGAVLSYRQSQIAKIKLGQLTEYTKQQLAPKTCLKHTYMYVLNFEVEDSLNMRHEKFE